VDCLVTAGINYVPGGNTTIVFVASHAEAYGQHSDIYRRDSSGFCTLLSNGEITMFGGGLQKLKHVV
jgi:hypothetical protein